MLTLLSKCIDRMNLYDSAAHFGEMAGEEAGAAWKDILNLLYELLGKDAWVMDHSKYPHLLSAPVSCWPWVDARHQSSPTVFAKSCSSSSHFSWHFLRRLFFYLSSFPPLTSINQPHPAVVFLYLEFTAGDSLYTTFIYNYLWQGSGDGSRGRFSPIFFSHKLSWLLPRSHPSLRSVRAHYEAFSAIFDEMMASLAKCQPSQVLALSHSLRGLYWVVNAKSYDPEKFWFSWTFSWVVCFAVIGAFSSTASPRLTLTALIFIITSPACTPTYTH